MTYQIALYFSTLEEYDISYLYVDTPDELLDKLQEHIDSRCLENHSLFYEIFSVIKIAEYRHEGSV